MYYNIVNIVEIIIFWNFLYILIKTISSNKVYPYYLKDTSLGLFLQEFVRPFKLDNIIVYSLIYLILAIWVSKTLALIFPILIFVGIVFYFKHKKRK